MLLVNTFTNERDGIERKLWSPNKENTSLTADAVKIVIDDKLNVHKLFVSSQGHPAVHFGRYLTAGQRP